MAINETGAIYKSLTYGGKTSREFGVYITGEGVYNAPERDVEMIDIPGRNGAYALDHGRFSNIEIEYPCSIAADNETDYREALSDFRNWLCSQKGYVRLTDDYNPDEYRLAVYKSGLEVSTVQQTAGEFTITFEAKPQRFLTSGETAITVQSGDTVNNPTLFDSSPLLEINGYGTINLGSNVIDFDGEDIGNILIAGSTWSGGSYGATTSTATKTITIDAALLRAGDAFTVTTKSSGYIRIQSGGQSIVYTMIDRYEFSATFSKGTAATRTDSVTQTITAAISIAYNGNQTVTIRNVCTMTAQANRSVKAYIEMSDIYAYSTTPSDTSLVYIDMDTGEAWTEISGEMASLNNRVTMPAKLPTLAPGNTTITYNNTVTQLKITPRYWII